MVLGIDWLKISSTFIAFKWAPYLGSKISLHPTLRLRLFLKCCRNRRYMAWYADNGAVLSCIVANRLILFSHGDTLSFPGYSHTLGTLCFLEMWDTFLVVCVFALDAKYTFPLNFGFKKSGALRLRCDRRGPTGCSSSISAASVITPLSTGIDTKSVGGGAGRGVDSTGGVVGICVLSDKPHGRVIGAICTRFSGGVGG